MKTDTTKETFDQRAARVIGGVERTDILGVWVEEGGERGVDASFKRTDDTGGHV